LRETTQRKPGLLVVPEQSVSFQTQHGRSVSSLQAWLMAGLTANNSRVFGRVFFSRFASFWSYGVVHCCIQQADR